jgi:hypothetical protein
LTVLLLQEEVEEEVSPLEEQKLPRGMLGMCDVKRYLQDLSCLEAALLADYPHGVPVRGRRRTRGGVWGEGSGTLSSLVCSWWITSREKAMAFCLGFKRIRIA